MPAVEAPARPIATSIESTALAAALAGGAGGLGGAALAHLAVTLANRLGQAELWLKGPYGPPFFNLALYMGMLCGGIGLSLSRRAPARAAPALLGLLGPLLGIALPLALLTRFARWGEDPSAAPTWAWYYCVGGLYIAATWGTLLGLGALLCPARRWLGALGAAGGAFAGYLALTALLWAIPSYQQVLWAPQKFIPSPVALLDGFLTGAGMGLGIQAARRKST